LLFLGLLREVEFHIKPWKGILVIINLESGGLWAEILLHGKELVICGTSVRLLQLPENRTLARTG